MRNGLRFIGIAALAALTLTALAIQDGLILKRSDKVGSIAKFRIKAEFEIKPAVGSKDKAQAASFGALLTETVKSIADNGNYTIESTSSEQKSTSGALEQAVPDRTDSMIVSNTGQVVTIISDTTNPALYRMANLDSLQFPATPLKVGDAWTFDIKKSDEGSVDAKGSFKVDGREKIGDFDTYRIIGSIAETGGAADAASTDATFWVSLKDGTVVKSIANWKNAPTPYGPTDMKVTLLREG